MNLKILNLELKNSNIKKLGGYIMGNLELIKDH